MSISEGKIYEALGLTAPQPQVAEGAQGQEPAEPAQPQTLPAEPEGAQGQGVAEPAQPAAASGRDPEPEGDPEDPASAQEKQPLTAEQRRQNAARRREQEQQQQQMAVDAAVNAALQAEKARRDEEMKSFFAKAGLKNTITGAPITSMAEFDEWNKQFQEAKLQRELKSGKLTQEGLASAIGAHPVVQQAAELVRQQEQQKAEQEKEADRARIQDEIRQIGQLDSSITSAADLLKMPKAKEFYDYVGKGYSFLDAYRLANFEELSARTAEAARQQALNSARSKEHLTPTGNPRGDGAVSVPQNVMRAFRQFNPNATEAQIQAYYNKYVKDGG
jgi:hypothetical protein